MSDRSKRKKRRRATRSAHERPERRQDRRLVATRAREMDGERLPPDTWVLAVSPLTLGDGQTILWHPPQPVAFALLEAKRYRDRGARERRGIMGNLSAREGPPGRLSPQNSRKVIDCISDLTVAVLFSFTAIESLANHSIDQLGEDATVLVERHSGEMEIGRDDMVRRLRLDEKYALAIPLLDQGEVIKGKRPWERFRHLKDLRDHLLHMKMRGYSPDPEVASIFDRLLLGEGDECVEDAVSVVTRARPDFLDDELLDELRGVPS